MAALVPSRIIIVMGVSSSGKSTAGQSMARRLHVPFLDGDGYHPESNVAKMRAGTPRTDEDRWPWLERLNSELRKAAGEKQSVVLACSALKKAYRERLAEGVEGLRMVLLTGSRELLAKRAAARTHRYMPPSLLDSQLATLEPLAPGEGWEIDVTPPVEAIVEGLAKRLGR